MNSAIDISIYSSDLTSSIYFSIKETIYIFVNICCPPYVVDKINSNIEPNIVTYLYTRFVRSETFLKM